MPMDLQVTCVYDMQVLRKVSQLEGFIEDNLSMLCNDMEPPEVDLDRILDVPPGEATDYLVDLLQERSIKPSEFQNQFISKLQVKLKELYPPPNPTEAPRGTHSNLGDSGASDSADSLADE